MNSGPKPAKHCANVKKGFDHLDPGMELPAEDAYARADERLRCLEGGKNWCQK